MKIKRENNISYQRRSLRADSCRRVSWMFQSLRSWGHHCTCSPAHCHPWCHDALSCSHATQQQQQQQQHASNSNSWKLFNEIQLRW